MYAITGTFRAYCFDRAVTTFGTALDAALDGVEGKNDKQIHTKRQRLLDTWMDVPLKFRSPAMPTSSGSDVEATYVVKGDGST